MIAWVSWKGHAWIALALRLYLGCVFVFASLHKIANPHSFALDVATYQFLPLGTVNLFALVVPWVELFAGMMFIIGLRVKAAALLISLMMMSFVIALAWALHLHLDMSCGCFASQGGEADPISWKTVLRDLSWLIMGIYVLMLDRSPLGIERVRGGCCKSRA